MFPKKPKSVITSVKTSIAAALLKHLNQSQELLFRPARLTKFRSTPINNISLPYFTNLARNAGFFMFTF